MVKVTPDPPATDPKSPSDSILSAANIMATPRKLSTMFIVNPELDTATLLAHACESLASANVMTMDLADRTGGGKSQYPAGHRASHHAGGTGGEPGAGPDRCGWVEDQRSGCCRTR